MSNKLLSGNKVKLEDGTIVNKPWATYKFITNDGQELVAAFTNEEIKEMKKKSPEIKWS